MSSSAPSPKAATVLVACLCAEWCRTCESYHASFAELREQNPGFRFVWVDIEDDAELVGDLEVETFPTLLIGVGEELRFLGPVLPQPGAAQRLLDAMLNSPAIKAGPAAQALLSRLQHSC